jgi:amino acid adenylation domain-containing protein
MEMTPPLSVIQKSMVLALERSPGSGVYVLQEICEFPENPDPDVLRQSWNIVSARHAALRTVIEMDSLGELSRRVIDRPEISWRETEADLDSFLIEDRRRGFQWSDGVAMRFTLLRNSATLVWTVHHALLDGRSLLIVWREWLTVYDALNKGVQFTLPPVQSRSPIEENPSARDYWRTQFDGISETSGYVAERVRHELGKSGFSKQGVELSASESEELLRLAGRLDITLNTLILGGWALLLSRYSGRSEVVFGVTRLGRGADEAEAVGLMINTLPFRVSVTQDAPVTDWLRRIRGQWMAQREFQQTPLTDIRKWSGLGAGMPLFESVLVYEREAAAETLGRLGGNRKFSRMQRTDSPLTLIAHGSPAVRLEIACDDTVFSRLTITGVLRHLKQLLISFPAAGEEGRLADLEMLTAEEQVHEGNQRRAAYPSICAHQQFEQQAARNPLRVALECESRVVTYGELNRLANQVAWALRSSGPGRDEIVAVCGPRSPETIAAVLGVLKASAAFLLLDPKLPAARLAQMIADCGVKRILTAGVPEEMRRSFHPCEVLRLDRMDGAPDTDLPLEAEPESLAYAIYTSGSTGKSKAAAVPHRALVNHTFAACEAFGITSADRRLQSAPIGSDVFVAEVFNYLSSGATIVFGLDGRGNSLNEYLRVIETRRITITGMPSSWWHEWVAAGCEIPASLRAVIAGMERVDPAALQTWKRLAGDKVRWFNAYGPTETALTATIYEAGSSEFECEAYVPIGKPHPNTQIHVWDASGRPVPDGVCGELYIGGAGVGHGYLNAPELTAQRFITGADGPLYRSGDVGFRLPDGNLVFVGRTDRQVKIRGFRIELEEIEVALAGHPDVRQCAVVVNEAGALAAYVVPGVPPSELKHYLSERLPGHMVPVSFTSLEAMPLTESGKIDRRSLETRRPLVVAGEVLREMTSTERRLAGIWERILKIGAVTSASDFFRVGGDSLSAVQLILQVRKEFGLELPFSALFQHPTVAAMGSLLDDGAKAGDLIPLRSHGAAAPLFCISSAATDGHRFAHIAGQLGEDQPVFALANPIEDGGRLQTVEELGQRVRRSIQQVRPKGPYILGGYCFGGVVAFEVARQMMAEGEEVRRVVLFDAIAPGYPKLLRNGRGYLSYLKRMMGLAGDPATAIGLAEIGEHLRFVIRHVRKRAVARTQRGLLEIGVAGGADDLFTLMARSARMYRPSAIAAPITQFLAQQDAVSTRVVEDPRLGWRDLCTSGFDAHPVRADHANLFLEEQAGEIGAILRDLLKV